MRCFIVTLLIATATLEVSADEPIVQPVAPPVVESAPRAIELPAPVGISWGSRDTLNIGAEKSDDARACLDGLCWPVADFKVHCEASRGNGDVLIRYPSPISSDNATNDTVALEWYAARDAEQKLIKAPAVVVVHESGKNMYVGRLIARGLQMQGLHAFMIQMPYYGERRANGARPNGDNLVPVIRQAVADVRRARDAVAVLPWVETKNISLQGTSLGGLVSATSAGLDRGYDNVFLMLAGGDLYDVLQSGQREATRFREELDKAGISGDKLKTLVSAIEPTRLAHRLNPDRTWLYTAQFDQVIPPKNGNLLAKAAHLVPSHHVQLLADHYSGILFLPAILPQIRDNINAEVVKERAAE